ncbi:hypothetical protein WR25_17501 [Diploscapter pachys]|uniref:Fibronectin type-III domain-containing protein n=1 Tax=Diploscapter pachys TaxID=2018661 RepID=A0A2A2L6E3_9BILA|nr:hypothetical protein WR25_17501 [Diploscapter pachys]
MENSRESTGELRLSEMETAEMKTEETEEEGVMPEEPSQGPPGSENGLEEEGPMQTQTEHVEKMQDDDTEVEEGDCWMLKAGPGEDQARKPLIGMGRKRRQSSSASAMGMGMKRINSNMNLHGHNCNFLPMDVLAENEVTDVKGMVFRLALPHVTLLLVSITYALLGGWILTIIKAHDQVTHSFELLENSKHQFVRHFMLNRTNRLDSAQKLDEFVQQVHKIYEKKPFNWNIGSSAKFCTEIMNRGYTEFMKHKFQVTRAYKRWRRGRLRRDSVKIGQVIIAGGEDEVAEFLWTHLEHAQFVEVPFLLVIGLLLFWIGFSSYAIAKIEGWSLTDGFYFVMMSVLTVGFGDLAPRNDSFTLVVLLIILAGLVLTTTCVDIVGAYYIDRLHFFGRRLEDDPLSWLKEVQQKRIEAMKREAMRKLFETVSALNYLKFTAMKSLVDRADEQQSLLPDPPDPPRELSVSHATADSVLLKWKHPIYVEEGRRYWFSLTYKPRNPQKRCNAVIVDFINTDRFLVTNLKSFTLYEFQVVTTTRFGCSKPAKAQEYTEPSTVPQTIRLDAISSESATVSWKSPKVNNGPEVGQEVALVSAVYRQSLALYPDSDEKRIEETKVEDVEEEREDGERENLPELFIGQGLLEEEGSSSTSHADESSWETNTSCSLNSKSVRFALDEEQDKQTGA